MPKNYFRSNLSKNEAPFLNRGKVIIGEENAITGLFRIIGMYSELSESCRVKDLCNYNPSTDKKFKYENRGITELSKRVKSKYKKAKFSRKCFTTLSRKWCPSPVVLSIKCDCIIQELQSYINSDSNLKSACISYLSNIGYEVENVMPIQFEFLSARANNQGKDFDIALHVVNKLKETNFK